MFEVEIFWSLNSCFSRCNSVGLGSSFALPVTVLVKAVLRIDSFVPLPRGARVGLKRMHHYRQAGKKFFKTMCHLAY